jgi:hypothetical protein
LHDVADASYVNEDLVGALVSQATTELADHRRPVLPRWRWVSNH